MCIERQQHKTKREKEEKTKRKKIAAEARNTQNLWIHKYQFYVENAKMLHGKKI